jgi:16S rRNA (guanine527-N7)-methyltransferase
MTQEAAAFQAATNVSRETLDRLIAFENQLLRWNPKINLVAKSTLSSVWTRHFLDSAQLLDFVGNNPKNWLDIGSGGGFPGAVAAILASERFPDCKFTLVEADKRKAAFLRTVARESGVSFNVLASRIEELPPQGCDIISARALAPLVELLPIARMHMASGGHAIFPKGANAPDEIVRALESWRFHCESHPSKTDKDAVILTIGDIERV